MRYSLDRQPEDYKLNYYNVEMSGLDITPNNGNPKISIRAKKITIVDQALIDAYVKKRINKKIDKVIEFMLRILNDDNSTEGDVGTALNDLNRLKGIVINKYKEHMIEAEYKALLTKIILVEEEFKRNYTEKMYRREMMNNYYGEERREGRSR